MAYPEPILPLGKKASKEFLDRLDAFHLTNRQKALYRGAKSEYEASARKD